VDHDLIHRDDYFERYAPLFVAIFTGPIAMALWFSAVCLAGGSPITEGVYGAAVYQVDALYWSAAQIALCLPAVIGFGYRIRWLAFLGAIGVALFLAMFAVLSMGAEEATLLQAVCLLWGGPLAWLAAASCYAGGRDVRR